MQAQNCTFVLYLTQILYLVVLIAAIRLAAAGFPYVSKQGSLIGIVPLSIPALVLVLLALLFLAASIPLAEQFFQLTQLHQPADYLSVGLAVLAWALLLHFVWLFVPQTRRI
jgi:hypothetical protein